MHIALSFDNDVSKKNMKKFIKSDGLRILINCMKLVYKDLLRSDSIHKDNLQSQLINYTNSETNSRYFKRNSEHICMGILSLKILDLIFREMC